MTPRRTPILSEFASDPEMAELISIFVSELPARVGALMSDWRAQDFSAVERAAHQLKGASAGHGFPAIGLAASRVESELRGRSAGRIAQEIPRITEALRDLTELCGRARA